MRSHSYWIARLMEMMNRSVLLVTLFVVLFLFAVCFVLSNRPMVYDAALMRSRLQEYGITPPAESVVLSFGSKKGYTYGSMWRFYLQDAAQLHEFLGRNTHINKNLQPWAKATEDIAKFAGHVEHKPTHYAFVPSEPPRQPNALDVIIINQDDANIGVFIGVRATTQ